MAKHTYSAFTAIGAWQKKRSLYVRKSQIKSMFKSTKYNGSGYDPVNKWDSTARNSTKRALVQEGQWRTHKLWQLSMLILAWAQHLGPSSLQTPGSTCTPDSKDFAWHKGMQGLSGVGLLEIIHIYELPQLATATEAQSIFSFRILLCFHARHIQTLLFCILI